MAEKSKAEIQNYWDQRAKENIKSPQATTNDIYLRELEVRTLVEAINELTLPPAARALDVGCGDGYTTMSVAERLPNLTFRGIDYSESMIDSARREAATRPELSGRIEFNLGDATNLAAACGDTTYDVVITDRCLINLTSFESQTQAISEIARHTKPGGHYFAIENFVEGQDNMNAMRASVGLPEIPIRWHNLFFNEMEFRSAVDPFFEVVEIKEFSSSYYFATRVIYSAMCQMRGEQPDYRHEIHQLAIHLPWTGQFSPIRMAVLRRRQ